MRTGCSFETERWNWEDLWAGLPQSSIYAQEALLCLREPSLGGGREGATTEKQCATTQLRVPVEITRALRELGVSVEALSLAVYHVVLQGYLRESESVIGCMVHAEVDHQNQFSRDAAIYVLPSYVYAEDSDDFRPIVSEANRHLISQVRAAVMRDSFSALTIPRFWFSVRADPGSGGIFSGGDPKVVELGVLKVGVDLQCWTRVPTECAHLLPPASLLDSFVSTFGASSSLQSIEVGHLKSQRSDIGDERSRSLDELEVRVRCLWAKVLGIPAHELTSVSNYFELGGNSLNAFKLVNGVRREFNKDIGIRDIAEHATVREFAVALSLA